MFVDDKLTKHMHVKSEFDLDVMYISLFYFIYKYPIDWISDAH